MPAYIRISACNFLQHMCFLQVLKWLSEATSTCDRELALRHSPSPRDSALHGPSSETPVVSADGGLHEGLAAEAALMRLMYDTLRVLAKHAGQGKPKVRDML